MPSEPFKPHRTILTQERRLAAAELERRAGGLLMSAALAGMALCASLLLLGVLNEHPAASPATQRLLLANAYGVGFVLVVMGRGDLFTEYTTVAILPVLTGESAVDRLIRLWVLVFVGNFAGGALVASLVAYLGPALGLFSLAAFESSAQALVDPAPQVLLASSRAGSWGCCRGWSWPRARPSARPCSPGSSRASSGSPTCTTW